jgi:hypothetical protein
VWTGKPDSTGGYETEQVEDITVYIPESFPFPKDKLKIELVKILFFKQLIVEGYW